MPGGRRSARRGPATCSSRGDDILLGRGDIVLGARRHPWARRATGIPVLVAWGPRETRHASGLVSLWCGDSGDSVHGGCRLGPRSETTWTTLLVAFDRVRERQRRRGEATMPRYPGDNASGEGRQAQRSEATCTGHHVADRPDRRRQAPSPMSPMGGTQGDRTSDACRFGLQCRRGHRRVRARPRLRNRSPPADIDPIRPH